MCSLWQKRINKKKCVTIKSHGSKRNNKKALTVRATGKVTSLIGTQHNL